MPSLKAKTHLFCKCNPPKYFLFVLLTLGGFGTLPILAAYELVRVQDYKSKRSIGELHLKAGSAMACVRARVWPFNQLLELFCSILLTHLHRW